ncbi:MAG TPA: flagella basal body P-ring formation protein FlgA, partial [Polyangiaceae bacterium]|nr:flagella basal body P-ring formation protein FlgA [Polyangiaceae bacterium]
RRVGEVTVLGMLPLSYAGQIVQRVPVSFVFDVSPAGAAPAVAKGAVLQVVVSTGSAQISALAEALSDADVGDTVQVRVNSTRRVVQAVIESSDRARVVAR